MMKGGVYSAMRCSKKGLIFGFDEHIKRLANLPVEGRRGSPFDPKGKFKLLVLIFFFFFFFSSQRSCYSSYSRENQSFPQTRFQGMA